MLIYISFLTFLTHFSNFQVSEIVRFEENIENVRYCASHLPDYIIFSPDNKYLPFPTQNTWLIASEYMYIYMTNTEEKIGALTKNVTFFRWSRISQPRRHPQLHSVPSGQTPKHNTVHKAIISKCYVSA